MRSAAFRVLVVLNEELRSAYLGPWFGMRDTHTFRVPGSPTKSFADYPTPRA